MKRLIELIFLMVIFSPLVVKAEKYYQNENGVSLTKKEYDYIVERFWDGYPEIMTVQNYNDLITNDLINTHIEIKEIFDGNIIMPLSESYSTPSKSLKITSGCVSNYCSITFVAKWLVNPKTRSYDVIGAFLQNTNLLSNPVTTITSSSGSFSSNEIVKQNNGFGVSVKLPTSANSIVISQYYNVSPNGYIYASYQHAKSSISLLNSKKYTLSRAGYGGVFLFDNDVVDKYDGMGGVNIAI